MVSSFSISFMQQLPLTFAKLSHVTTNPKRPRGPPMTLGNMREQGVHHLICYCLNDACRHQALIDV